MVRYGISFVGKAGLRVLMGPAQGRFMHDSAEDATAFFSALMTNTGEDRLVQCHGISPEVRSASILSTVGTTVIPKVFTWTNAFLTNRV